MMSSRGQSQQSIKAGIVLKCLVAFGLWQSWGLGWVLGGVPFAPGVHLLPGAAVLGVPAVPIEVPN